MTLEALLTNLDEQSDAEMEVCLVDEVVETLIDDDGSGNAGPAIVASDADDEVLGTFGGAEQQDTTAAPTDVRAMLDKLFDADGESDEPRQ